MTTPPCLFEIGARVRERGTTVFFVPVPHERPARSGTVVWAGPAMAVVHWDGAPAPNLARPAGDDCVTTAWLQPLPANDSPSHPERTAP